MGQPVRLARRVLQPKRRRSGSRVGGRRQAHVLPPGLAEQVDQHASASHPVVLRPVRRQHAKTHDMEDQCKPPAKLHRRLTLQKIERTALKHQRPKRHWRIIVRIGKSQRIQLLPSINWQPLRNHQETPMIIFATCCVRQKRHNNKPRRCLRRVSSTGRRLLCGQVRQNLE